MFIAKLKIAGLVLVAGSMAATGSVVVVQHVLAETPAAQQVQADKAKAGVKAEKAESVASKESQPKADSGEKRVDPETEARLKLRRQSMNNLKTLGMAFHNYNATEGTFPAAATYRPDGKPLLSWRVHLLPYLDQGALYKKFKLDEPWDSPHNKPLLATMPDVYRAPGLEKKHPDETFYQVFTGKGTAFDGNKGLPLDEFTDGLSSTILIAEAGKPIPWTSPEEIRYDADKPLPKLGGVFKDGFCTCLGDGSARFIPRDIADSQLRPYLTPKAADVASPF